MSTSQRGGVKDAGPGLGYVFTSNYFIFNLLALMVYPIARRTMLHATPISLQE